MDVALQIGIALGGTLAIFLGSRWIDAGAEVLCERFQLPDAVRGGLILAVASSFPELVAAVGAALWHDDPELGFASVAGSAVFNVTIIPAASAIGARTLDVDRPGLRREALFYLASVVALGASVYWAWQAGGQEADARIEPLMVIPPAVVYVLYVWHTLRTEAPPPFERDEALPPAWKGGAQVLAGITLVVVGVEGLLQFVTWLGDAVGTPTFVWGATVIAAATSFPDLALSVRAARRGRSVIALTNAFGSNVFDLSAVIAFTAVVAGGLLVDAATAAALLVAISVITTVAVLLVGHGGVLRRRDAIPLGLLYLAFVGVAVAMGMT